VSESAFDHLYEEANALLAGAGLAPARQDSDRLERFREQIEQAAVGEGLATYLETRAQKFETTHLLMKLFLRAREPHRNLALARAAVAGMRALLEEEGGEHAAS